MIFYIIWTSYTWSSQQAQEEPPGGGHDKATPVFLPGEFHGQRSLAHCSPQAHTRVGHNWSDLAHIHTQEQLKWYKRPGLTCIFSETVTHFSPVWLCDPMDCSLPGSSVHGILQVKTLEWVAMPFSKASSWSRDRTQGLLYRRLIFYHLSHQGSPLILDEWSESCSIVFNFLWPHRLYSPRDSPGQNTGVGSLSLL